MACIDFNPNVVFVTIFYTMLFISPFSVNKNKHRIGNSKRDIFLTFFYDF